MRAAVAASLLFGWHGSTLFDLDRVIGVVHARRLLARDDREVPVDESAAPIDDDRGERLGAAVVLRDVTLEVLADDLYAAEVRAAEDLWRSRGINGVPAVVVEGKWLISGGQPAGVFEEALRGMAAGG